MSAFERLRQLLLAPEQERIEQLAADRARQQQEQESLPDRLPELLAKARQKQPDALTRALAEPVADALGEAVQSRRQTIVDALFPVIMPAIRRAIAEYLRNLSADLNRVVESSFTWRGLKWRLEARRSGLPYATVALRHSLRYQVDHLFLIQRGSGLVLDRESADGLPKLDSDAISGMLTAIGEFVKDSVADPVGDLSSATVGEHLLWVLSGPDLNLAAFIRGVPPESLKTELATRLERLHQQFGERLAAAPETLVDLPEIKDALTPQDLRAVIGADDGGQSMRTLVLVGGIAVLLVLAWLIAQWTWRQRLAQLTEAIDARAGVRVLAVDDALWRRVRFEVLKDPLAEPLMPWLRAQLPASVDLVIDEEGFVSTDAAMVWARVQQRWPQASLQVDWAGARPRITGTAPPDWLRTWPLIPGSDLFDLGIQIDWRTELDRRFGWPATLRLDESRQPPVLRGQAGADWIARVKQYLADSEHPSALDFSGIGFDAEAFVRAANAALSELPVTFAEAARTSSDDLGPLQAELLRQYQQWRRQNPPGALRLLTFGRSDPLGDADDNRELEAARANWLAAALNELGLREGFVVAADSDPAPELAKLRQRVALAQWVIELPP